MSTWLHESRGSRRAFARLAFVLVLSMIAGALGATAAWARVAPSDFGAEDGARAAALTKESPGSALRSGTNVKNLTNGFLFATIQDAIDDAGTTNGDVLEMQVSSHSEGIVTVTKGVTIRGATGGTTILALANTGTSGDARGWFLVTAPGVAFEEITFDGDSDNSRSIYQAIRFTSTAAGGSVDGCSFVDVTGFPLDSYDGRGIATVATISVTDCDFANIRRIGVHIFGPTAAGTTVSGCTYTGKGAVDALDYGIELGGGAVATLTGNTITNCTAVASDGSTSAGILITDYFAPGTAGSLANNFVNGSTAGIAVGYLATDVSDMTASDNDLSGNAYGIDHTNASYDIDASANWWGSNAPATVAAAAGIAVDFTPWLDVATDTDGATGFQGSFSTLDVDDDSPQTGSTGRVQEGVNLVTASTVNIAAGTYEEQVIISGMDVELVGAGAASTTIQAPTTLATTFTTSGPNKPVISASSAANVVIRDLKVDGMGRGNANNRLVGIGYWNAGGAVLDCVIDRVRNNPLDGVQAGVGILAANNTGGPYALEVGGVTITDYQKNAMVLANSGLTVDVHDCATTGAGPTTLIAQNGIQISSGAAGSVTDCSISDMDYTPDTVVSAGLLVLPSIATASTGPVTVSGANAITNVQEPVYWWNSNGSMSGIDVTGGADPYDAIFVYNSTASEPSAAPGLPSGRAAQRVAAPFDAELAEGAAPGGSPAPASAYTVSISNSCLDGGGLSATNVGVYAYSAGGPVSVSVTNCTVTGFAYGCVADGAATSVTANTNSIAGNATAGFDNTLSLGAQDAEDNWWGAADGPSGVGAGSGDAVLGTGVDFTPWRTNGYDASPACGFQPDDNTVAADPPGCISITNPCVTVPMNVTRADATPMRGYSVTFTLSPELMLCSGLGSITQGTYLSSIGLTNFQVLSNGGGSYTVDCAILGLPCGATAATGTLFDVAVKASGGDGTGTITVDFVTMRDCSNATIPGAPGAAASIDIDTAAPSAITLTSTQDKTSNGVDGRTFIDIVVPPVAGGDVVRVYRKGFGNYPEYDDAPGAGSVPAVPATEAAALLAGWTLTGVTATGADDPPVRDFWYHVAFVEDPCGNVSGATSIAGGTLNYHLGDTHDGVTDCVGNNLVNTADISFLGANYGLLLGVSDPKGCLDVGPTTDFSVDARPTTDNKIQFEDLIMFAINYGQVSKTDTRPTAEAADEVALVVEEAAKSGGTVTARLEASGTGRVQAVSARLSWDPLVVTPVSMAVGELIERNGGVAFTPEPGLVDAAVLGTGGGGLTGRGTLATVTFRVIGAGDPRIGLASVDARDAENARIAVGMKLALPGRETAGAARTELFANVPNPFNPATKVAFRLAEAGEVRLSVFTADGRRVRTLVSGRQDAGLHETWWNGRNDRGEGVSSGTYYLRLETAAGSLNRTITLLK